MTGNTSFSSRHMAHIKGIVEVVCTMRGKNSDERVRVANVCKEAVLNFQTASSDSVQLEAGITGDLEVFKSKGYVVVNGPCVQVLDPEQRPVSIQMAPDISTIVALRDSNGLLVVIGKCQLRNKRVAVVLDMFSDQKADLVIDDYQKFIDKRQGEAKSGQHEANINNSLKDGDQGDISKIQYKAQNEHFASNVKHYRAFVIEGFPTEMDTDQLKYAVPEDKRAFIFEIHRISNKDQPSTSVSLIWKSSDQSPPGVLTLHHDKEDLITLTLKEVEQPMCFKCLVLGQVSCFCEEKKSSQSSEIEEKVESIAKDLPQDSNIPLGKSLTQHKDFCKNTALKVEPDINELSENPQVVERMANIAIDCNERNVNYEEYERILLENEQMKHQLVTYEKRVQELESLVNELHEEKAAVSCTKSVDGNARGVTTAHAEQKEDKGRCTVS